ncbi:MAG: hypothetical protein K6F11_04970 [Lachnospiraceae bacterium]|nr:hypothetical protein [Lachnospiraceae bacterium]
MEEKGKKRQFRGFKRKHFIIGLLTVCAIAVIAEAVLLIHTFSKKKSPEKGSEKVPKNTAQATVTGEAAPSGKRVWKAVEVTESLEGVVNEEATFLYDETGRVVGVESDYGDRHTKGVITYEKSGVKVVFYTGEEQQWTYFVRNIEKEVSAEIQHVIKQPDFDLEYDENGFWKRITYRSTVGNVTTLSGFDFTFDDLGRMTGCREWRRAEGYQDEEVVRCTETFEYDDQGRVIRYLVDPALYRSDVQGGEYLLTYDGNRKTQTKYIDGVKKEETEWEYLEKGTWKTIRSYSSGETTERKEWSVNMPESYTEVESAVTMSSGLYLVESGSIDVFETDSDGNVIRVTSYPEGANPITMYTATYNEKGRITELKEKGFDVTRFDYDEHGNVIKVTWLDGDEVVKTTEVKYKEIIIPNS